VECSKDPAAPGIVGIDTGHGSTSSRGALHCD
jgi:hypothetical protein